MYVYIYIYIERERGRERSFTSYAEVGRALHRVPLPLREAAEGGQQVLNYY